MTAKQQQILKASTHLFTENGYHATSTLGISKRAEVSEGLIFRHFRNKETLLIHVLNACDIELAESIEDIIAEDDAKRILEKVVLLPFHLKEVKKNTLWQLFRLTSELGRETSNTLIQLDTILRRAFENLYYKYPEFEVQLIRFYLEGATKGLHNESIEDPDFFRKCMLNKYHIN